MKYTKMDNKLTIPPIDHSEEWTFLKREYNYRNTPSDAPPRKILSNKWEYALFHIPHMSPTEGKGVVVSGVCSECAKEAPEGMIRFCDFKNRLEPL